MILPAFLIPLLPKLKIALFAGVAVAVAAAGIYVWSLRAANARLTDELGTVRMARDKAIAASKINAAAIATAKREHQRELAVLESANRTLRTELETRTRLRTEIDHAPATDDGPVAPVLRRALDGLRVPARPGGGDGGKARATRDPADPADLRPDPQPAR